MSFARRVTPEIMDEPGLDPSEHRKALAGLRRINRASNVPWQMLEPIAQFARREKLSRLSLLDIACGGGDVPVALAVLAKEQKIQIDLTLLDRSQTALDIAAAAAETAGVACAAIRADAVSDLPAGAFDVVTNSLFLHHLPGEEAVVDFLASLARLSPRQIVISDLLRSRLGYFAAWAACRLLTRSAIVHFDGPVSVRAAWTLAEAARFAAAAQMKNTLVRHCWPQRMLLVWERPIPG